MKVLIKKLVPEAVIPTYAHIDENGNPNDMCMDITCTSFDYDAERDRYIYHTGLAFKLPQGYGMLILPRSSNTKTEAYLANSVGILDSTYTGELMFMYKLRTHKQLFAPGINGNAPYEVGDRIGQILILPYPTIEFLEVDELPKTDRGSDGGLIRNDNNFK